MSRIKATICILTLICALFASCKLFESNEPNDTIPDSTRFKELETPIEGKLLFVVGPSHFGSDSMSYMNDKFDFYQLNGSTFTKLNDNPIINGPGQLWNFKWSNNGNYLAFFHDRNNQPDNTDDIAVFDFSSMELNYLTETLGDANTYDEAIFSWANDESFLYFTALPLGVSEYSDPISPDIFRAKPDGSLLEQITDNDYYEAHAVPSPDGTKIFYGIFPWKSNPDTLYGYHIYDLSNDTTNQLYSMDELLERYRFHIHQTVYWHPNGSYLLLIVDGSMLVKINVELSTIGFINISEIVSWGPLIFNPVDENKVFMYGRGGNDLRNREIYSLDLTTVEFENLTINLTTLDNQPPELNNLAVSPNGYTIAFTANIGSNSSNYNSYKDQKTEIYTLDVKTKMITQLTNGVDGWEGHLKWIE